MLKWYADNSEMSTEKGKPNVLIFGGVIVDNKSEKQIEQLLRQVKKNTHILHYQLNGILKT